MTVRLKTKLIRVGRAKVLTRSGVPGSLPEVTNPIERYF